MTAKPTINYAEYPMSMSDLLREHDIHFRRDFTDAERSELQESLMAFMTRNGGSGTETLSVDLKRIVLTIQGADEAGHLLPLIR